MKITQNTEKETVVIQNRCTKSGSKKNYSRKWKYHEKKKKKKKRECDENNKNDL